MCVCPSVGVRPCVCAWLHLLSCNSCSWQAEVVNADLQIDRLFDWKAQTDAPIQQSLNSQQAHVKREFDERLKQSVLNLNEQGLNVALYWQNPDKRKYVNVVPTSAITGEGLPDMLQLLVDLTQVPPAAATAAVLCCGDADAVVRLSCIERTTGLQSTAVDH